ncbi:arsenate reductase family protein [Halarcobacter ebronensis]|uniref:Arsenate reductase family protein n=1 Tax=Halarcobacter ebronensis TaxID=1462615 RepID=A0A4Q0YK00_9BACT|nr:ArsC/Spx/MgsR family protein [Halarcobacter ebronensis]RXJ69361.1 arsenate reductase family protein [Halarcobacter ebronensis]
MFYVKKRVVFYEKPGCAGNKRQKEVLRANRVEFEVKSMLEEKWNTQTLNSFFYGLEKEQIINQFAPQVKSGELNIENYTKEELINLMIKEPLLIKRPLIEVDDIRICGFDIPKLNLALNLELDTNKEIDTCQSSDSCTTV